FSPVRSTTVMRIAAGRRTSLIGRPVDFACRRPADRHASRIWRAAAQSLPIFPMSASSPGNFISSRIRATNSTGLSSHEHYATNRPSRLEDLARRGAVLADLRNECLEPGELHLVANPRHEFDLDQFAVYVAIEVEKMGFENDTAAAVNGRADTDVGDARQWPV